MDIIALTEIKEMLITAPDSQLDQSMIDKIKLWSAVPTSLNILEVLDNCIYAALASGFVINVLETLLNEVLAMEGKVLEDILPEAVWRVGLD